jgi:hypothetical protein
MTVSVSLIAEAEAAPIEALAPRSRLATKDPNRIEYSKDSTGRMIGARPIDALTIFDISILMGEHSGNGAALNQALMAASVVSIDGRDAPKLLSLVALRARIQQLGLHGYAVVNEAVAKFSDEDGEVNEVALKNS